MGRTKRPDSETLLVHKVFTRVNERTMQRLQTLLTSSNCHTIGQLVRHILSNQRIIYYKTDVTVEEPVQHLIEIREQLRAIGVNVNQITHQFHKSESPQERVFHALKVSDEYAKVGEKVDVLIKMVAEIGKQWLQRSFQEEQSEV